MHIAKWLWNQPINSSVYVARLQLGDVSPLIYDKFPLQVESRKVVGAGNSMSFQK